MSANSSSIHVQQLLERCTGQTVKIPFLFSLFPAWKAQFNPNYEQGVQDELFQFQQRWMRNPISLKRNCAIDSIFFSRSVFPNASLGNLKTVVLWLSWLYFWDDALDFGELDNDPGELQRQEREILTSIQQSLLGPSTADLYAASFVSSCCAAQAWFDIASARNFMYKCLHDYVTATIKLQNHCDRADILDIESYLAIRMNTSGVYPTMSLYLFTFPSDPPTWFFSHELVKEAFLQINRIVSTYNDIVSAHQEIKSGHVDNIIPLLIYQKGLTAQEAVDEAIEIIKVSYVTFLSLETKLTSLGQERGITREVEDFLQACINLCMGALQWT
ncbi:hypothetical protein MW887_004299 [Aspergillus wentii]|nr:hypothetical protein MW887_004299 [Aspergillus wentii]